MWRGCQAAQPHLKGPLDEIWGKNFCSVGARVPPNRARVVAIVDVKFWRRGRSRSPEVESDAEVDRFGTELIFFTQTTEIIIEDVVSL